MFHLLKTPATEAAWAQWANAPSDPDSRSPCPPHLLPLPAILHEITEEERAQLWGDGHRTDRKRLSLTSVQPTQTFAPVSNEILFSLQHHGEVAHGYAELHDVAVVISAVHGLVVLTRQHVHKISTLTHTIHCNVSPLSDWPTSDSYSLVNSIKLGVRMPFWYPWMTDGCWETSHNPSCWKQTSQACSRWLCGALGSKSINSTAGTWDSLRQWRSECLWLWTSLLPPKRKR